MWYHHCRKVTSTPRNSLLLKNYISLLHCRTFRHQISLKNMKTVSLKKIIEKIWVIQQEICLLQEGTTEKPGCHLYTKEKEPLKYKQNRQIDLIINPREKEPLRFFRWHNPREVGWRTKSSIMAEEFRDHSWSQEKARIYSRIDLITIL